MSEIGVGNESHPARAKTPAASGGEPPLFVDLDGTLIAADSLKLSLIHLALRRPWRTPGVCFSLRKGRAGFKAAVACCVRLDPSRLPYRADVVAFLRERRAVGQPLILATAADRSIAEPVAAHLQLFDAVLATTPDRNLRGRRKLEAIQQMTRGGPFDYIGDHAADLPIWEAARHAQLVRPGPRLLAAAKSSCRVHRVF